MLNFKGKDLYIESVKVSDIAKKYGSAIFIYSKNQLLENLKKYQSLSGNKTLICFACKTNSNGSILRIVAKAGAGADTTSGGEIFRCLQAGFNPSKIVYAGVGKTQEEIEYALKNKIFMFNVESFEELEAINKIAAKLKTKANIAFRINPEVDPHTHSHIVTGKKGTKFGIPYNEAIKAYIMAKNYKNILPIGIHSHIGSQILDIEPFKLAANRIKKIVNEVEKNGLKIDYVNCGGGLGVAYEKNQKAPLPSKLFSAITNIFKGENRTFIFEPGRSVIAEAGYLLCKVIYRKKSGGKSFLIVDAGMNDLIRPSLYDAYHDIVPIKKISANRVKTDIVGPICESGDFMGKDRMLPILNQGEYLLVTCAGAYVAAMSSQYNSRPLLPEVLVYGDKVSLIRKRSSYKDLLLNEI
jgi:diaminopimelate decarboxylase